MAATATNTARSPASSSTLIELSASLITRPPFTRGSSSCRAMEDPSPAHLLLTNPAARPVQVAARAVYLYNRIVYCPPFPPARPSLGTGLVRQNRFLSSDAPPSCSCSGCGCGCGVVPPGEGVGWGLDSFPAPFKALFPVAPRLTKAIIKTLPPLWMSVCALGRSCRRRL